MGCSVSDAQQAEAFSARELLWEHGDGSGTSGLRLTSGRGGVLRNVL